MEDRSKETKMSKERRKRERKGGRKDEWEKVRRKGESKEEGRK